jgi:hypothetical protein
MRRPHGLLELGRYRETVKGEELVQVGEFVVPGAISRVGGMHLHKGMVGASCDSCLSHPGMVPCNDPEKIMPPVPPNPGP